MNTLNSAPENVRMQSTKSGVLYEEISFVTEFGPFTELFTLWSSISREGFIQVTKGLKDNPDRLTIDFYKSYYEQYLHAQLDKIPDEWE